MIFRLNGDFGHHGLSMATSAGRVGDPSIRRGSFEVSDA